MSNDFEPVAIVGIGCRFPGAPNPTEFWRMIENSDTAKAVPPSPNRLLPRDTKACFLDDVEGFDWRAFKIAPREMKFLDPQHRLLLEVAWEAFEDAGIPHKRLQNSKTAVLVGLSWNDYQRLMLEEQREMTGYEVTGTPAFAANRISHSFGLTGPSLSVDGNCISSLNALHYACMCLNSGEADLALAGGVNLLLSAATQQAAQMTGALSEQGVCRPFDQLGDGFVRGEGAGLVVLKRVSDLTPVDRVYATINHISVNHNGNNRWIMVPKTESQIGVISDAWKPDRLDSGRLGYVELHGTGSAKGDATEIKAIAEAIDLSSKSENLLVGSVKGNIGNLESAAGIASIIKVALSIYHGKLPGTANLNKVRAELRMEEHRLRVSGKSENWDCPLQDRVAAVHSTSLSGGNAHVVMSGNQSQSNTLELTTSPAPSLCIVPVSAYSPEALQRRIQQTQEFLTLSDELNLRDLGFTYATGRSQLKHRAVFIGNSHSELLDDFARCVDAPTVAVQSVRIDFDCHVFAGPIWTELITSNDSFRATVMAVAKRLEIEDILQKLVWTECKNYPLSDDIALCVHLGFMALLKRCSSQELQASGKGVGALAAAVVNGELEFSKLKAELQSLSSHLADDKESIEKNEIIVKVGGAGFCCTTFQGRSHDSRNDGTIDSLFRTLCTLFIHGWDINWETIYPSGHYLSLPTYPWEREPFWLDGQEEQSKPNEQYDSGLREKIAALPQRQAVDLLISILESELAKVLGLPESKAPSCDEPLFTWGLTSIAAVELQKNLQTTLGIELSRTFFFKLPTLLDAAISLEQQLSGRIPTSQARHEQSEIYKRGSSDSDEPIAIVGLACRFPGKANDLASYWKLLKDKGDAIIPVPSSRWSQDTMFDADREAPGKVYANNGGFLQSDIKAFDPAFFGISPREAVYMDPQQRLLLEVCWEAFEHAGIPSDSLRGSKSGVFIGAMSSDYSRRIELNNIDAYYASGNHLAFTSGRISHFFGLLGPSISIDTACSSSLVAIHQACESLRSKESNLAIAGGVNIILSPENSVFLAKAGLMSDDGRCKSFSDRANGIGRGEGCSVVVLKRLEDAVADGDRIMGTILSSSVNHDGRSSGITVPSQTAQEELIYDALRKANLSPTEVDYVECHGTGTPLGDPIEAAALTCVFSDKPNNALPIGSVKSNLGHLEAAAGVAGLVKTLLALEHEFIPAQINCERPSSKISWDSIPIFVANDPIPWPRSPRPRNAGISSFGLSGVNAHVMLSDVGVGSRSHQDETSWLQDELLLLSARTPEALNDSVKKWVDYLATTQNSVQDLCKTAALGRNMHEYRMVVIGATKQALSTGLCDERNVRRNKEAITRSVGIAFLFSGQGSQYVGMGKHLFEQYPPFRKRIETCSKILKELMEVSLESILFDDAIGDSLLYETQYAQPAIFSLELALAETWRDWGVEPSYVVGHSVGELAAACFSGACSLEDGLEFAVARGKIMQHSSLRGAMLSLRAEPDILSELILEVGPTVSVAAYNSEQSIVLSGGLEEIKRLEKSFSSRARVKILSGNSSFHSALMEPFIDAINRASRKVAWSTPTIPWISTLDGQLIQNPDELECTYWGAQARKPVRFADAIQYLSEVNISNFLAIGPDTELLALATLASAKTVSLIPSLRKGRDDIETISQSLAECFVGGVEIDWQATGIFDGANITSIPSYPFQREKYWVEEPSHHLIAASTNEGGAQNLLGHCLPSIAGRNERVFELNFNSNRPYLSDHLIHDVVIAPGTALLQLAWEAARVHYRKERVKLINAVFTAPLAIDTATEVQRIQIISSPNTAQLDITIYSAIADSDSEWLQNCVLSFIPYKENMDTDFQPPALDVLKKEATRVLGHEAIYRQLATMKLGYGSSFRGLSELWMADNWALGALSCIDGINYAANRCIHPPMLDATIHGLALLVSTEGDGLTYVPVGIEEMILGSSDKAPHWVYLRITSESSSVRPSGDVFLLTEHGELHSWLRGIQLSAISQDDIYARQRGQEKEWFHKIEWEAAEVTAAETASEKNAVVLIGNPHDGNLEHALPNVQVVDCSSVQSLEAVLKEPNCPRHIVYLAPLSIPDEIILSNSHLMAVGLAIVQTILTRRDSSEFQLSIVTRGAQSVHDTDVVDPFQSLLWGLARVCKTEYPQLVCRIFDLDDDDRKQAHVEALNDIISGRVMAAERESQIAIRDGLPFVPRLVPQKILFEPLAVDAESRFGEGTYLITGGFGALGRRVANWLVDQGARCLVLISRRAPANNDYVQSLQERGVLVTIVECDISDRKALQSAIKNFSVTLPPLKGIVHAAGISNDGAILSQNWQTFRQGLQGKVVGAWNLHQLTKDKTLDFFLLFSSSASILGPLGQASYASGNCFLDGLAKYRRQQGLPGQSLSWGPWDGGGMMSVEGKTGPQFWERQGMTLIDADDGLKLMAMAMKADMCHLGIFQADFEVLKSHLPADACPPILYSLGADETALSIEGSATQLPDLSTLLNGKTNVQKREIIEEKISICIASVLRLKDKSLVQVNRPVSKMGMDSLMALELQRELSKITGHALPVTLMFDYPTVEDIAWYLFDEVFEFSRDEESSEDRVSQTDFMTEDDVVKRLQEKLLSVTTKDQ